MKVVLTGGGTGGHVYPAISVGQALRANMPDIELLFVGSSHGPEGAMAANAGFEFRAIPSLPLTKSVSIRNAAALLRLAAGIFRARNVLREFGPDVVLGTGGYTTAAVLIAARSLRRPIAIHEQNAVPGRTNSWLARIVDRICVSFDSTAAFFPQGKVVVTGMPVRREFAALPAGGDARRALGLDRDRFTILVVGGSQGAKNVNDIVIKALPLIDDGATQVLHQVGDRNVHEACRLLDSLYGEDVPGDYRMEAYVDMPLAMAAADLVISRSGSTVAEITAAGLPSILFPYPYHRDQHQKRNAEYLVEHRAAILCEDDAVSAQMLAGVISDLRSSPDKLRAMASASAALGKVDAAGRVADVVTRLAAERVGPTT